MLILIPIVSAVDIRPNVDFANQSLNYTVITAFSPVNITVNASELSFDVNQSVTVYDYSYRNNDGTVTGVIWNSSGYIGGAYNFDGTTGSGTLDLSAMFTFTGSNQYVTMESGCTLGILSGGGFQ